MARLWLSKTGCRGLDVCPVVAVAQMCVANGGGIDGSQSRFGDSAAARRGRICETKKKRYRIELELGDDTQGR